MIDIRYDRRSCSLTVSGHAQSGEPGHDLVCSAASILAYTMAENVLFLKENGMVKNVTTHMDVGNVEIRCTPKKEAQQMAEIIMSSVAVGFELLAKYYGEYVTFEDVKIK